MTIRRLSVVWPRCAKKVKGRFAAPFFLWSEMVLPNFEGA